MSSVRLSAFRFAVDRGRLWMVVLGLLSVSVPAPAQAQQMGDGFFFKPPGARLTITGGFAGSRAKSEIYRFTTEQLTVNRSDFGAPAVEMDLGFRTSAKSELSFGLAYARSSTRSEFRDWVDQDSLPIQQTTSLTRVPLLASLKLYLVGPGRSVGRLAWLPAPFSLYVGGGGGAMWYKFDQNGDWVDYQSYDIFTDEFKTSGWGIVGQVMGGAEVALTSRYGITAEVRRHWASGPLSNTFIGFNHNGIDLSGTTTRAGLFLRF